MRLYDAHTHLNNEQLFPVLEDCLKRFIEVWWVGLVNVGASDFYNEKGIEIAKNYFPKESLLVKASVGLHPEVVDTEVNEENMEAKIENLKQMIQDNREFVVGVGECGIDLHQAWSLETLDLQKRLFSLQCDLARELNLPLIVHSRDGFDQTLDVLKEYRDLVVYFHCRWYEADEVERLKVEGQRLNWKLFIWFCGNVTYKKADVLRESLKLVPLESLVLETDAPYLSPQVVRWEQNEPANVKYIYEFVAEYLWMDIEKLAQQCEVNFKSLYNV